jgi:type III secretion system chaperone SycN
VIWIEDTLKEFGQGIGVDNLHFNPQGVCCLKLEETGTLYIERRDEVEVILVYLVRQIPFLDDETLSKALALNHFRNAWPLPVGSALREDDQLVFITWIESTDFSLPILEKAIRLLMNLFNQMEQ